MCSNIVKSVAAMIETARMYVSLIFSVGVMLVICHSANAQCLKSSVPTGCLPTGTTCIASNIKNTTVTNWFEMEDVCQQDNGRLVWLRDDLDIDHILGTTMQFRKDNGLNNPLLIIGLLSSTTASGGGYFWRNTIDKSTFQCNDTETETCLSNSSENECNAIGCCWENGQCQYPVSQNLATFKLNDTELAISGSTERKCVGFQFNSSYAEHGYWMNYNCSEPVDNALYVCEYKCNADDWPIMNATNFVYEAKTSSTKSTTETPTAANGITGATETTSSPQVGNNLNCNKNSLLKVLLSLETGGAITNMSFSLQQKSP